jgi:hypothetical protein
MFMELLQAGQHIILGYNDHDGGCTRLNQLSTIMAYVLIWMQPGLFLYIYQSATWNRNSMMTRLIILMMGTALLFLGMGFMGDITYNAPNTNYDNITCTKYGYGNHLDWRFAVKSLQYSPNYFVYMGIIVVIIMELPAELYYTIGLGWVLTLVISVGWVGFSPVLPSVWCLNSVLVDIPILYRVFRSQQSE